MKSYTHQQQQQHRSISHRKILQMQCQQCVSNSDSSLMYTSMTLFQWHDMISLLFMLQKATTSRDLYTQTIDASPASMSSCMNRTDGAKGWFWCEGGRCCRCDARDVVRVSNSS